MVVDGTVDSADFEVLARQQETDFGLNRRFCEDSELFHAAEKTYDLTNRWGRAAKKPFDIDWEKSWRQDLKLEGPKGF